MVDSSITAQLGVRREPPEEVGAGSVHRWQKSTARVVWRRVDFRAPRSTYRWGGCATDRQRYRPYMKGGMEMRFMVIVRATKRSEAGILPDEKLLTAMGKYNEELMKAGVLLAGEGLQPSSKGARVKFSGTTRTVADGPFAEVKELIAGF